MQKDKIECIRLTKQVLMAIAEKPRTVRAVKVICPDHQSHIVYFKKGTLRNISTGVVAITKRFGDVEYKVEALEGEPFSRE